MNLSDLSTQLLYTTVPLWAEMQTGTSSATAFIYSAPYGKDSITNVPLIVTSLHAVAGAKRVVVELIERKGDLPDPQERLLVDIDPSTFTQFSDDKLDLAAAPIGALLNERESAGKPLFFRSIDQSLVPSESALEELSAMEDVVFIGYPSGLRDIKNSNPLIRRGITATPVWNQFQGEPFFLIDAGVFPGSSGSPVFILNQGAYGTGGGLVVGHRLLFLGVVCSSMMRPSTPLSAPDMFLGLGKVVRSDVVRDFLHRTVEALVHRQPREDFKPHRV